jgi:1-acyl-sn-glycerol-3-phosphate acyltransferase
LELARLAGVPIVPAVVWGTSAYGRATAWLPWPKVRYGINYGEGIVAGEDAGERLAGAWRELHGELMGAMALGS